MLVSAFALPLSEDDMTFETPSLYFSSRSILCSVSLRRRPNVWLPLSLVLLLGVNACDSSDEKEEKDAAEKSSSEKEKSPSGGDESEESKQSENDDESSTSESSKDEPSKEESSEKDSESPEDEEPSEEESSKKDSPKDEDPSKDEESPKEESPKDDPEDKDPNGRDCSKIDWGSNSEVATIGKVVGRSDSIGYLDQNKNGRIDDDELKETQVGLCQLHLTGKKCGYVIYGNTG